jgi:hypothetical protein
MSEKFFSRYSNDGLRLACRAVRESVQTPSTICVPQSYNYWPYKRTRGNTEKIAQPVCSGVPSASLP